MLGIVLYGQKKSKQSINCIPGDKYWKFNFNKI